MIGPRNRRRLAIGGIAAAVIVAGVATVLVTRPTSHSAAHALGRWKCVGGPSRVGSCVMSFGGLTFGMTKSQVQHRLGKPESTRGRCWVYPDEVGQYLASKGVVKSVVDVCFLSGRYSDRSGESYVRRHGKLVLWHPAYGPGS